MYNVSNQQLIGKPETIRPARIHFKFYVRTSKETGKVSKRKLRCSNKELLQRVVTKRCYKEMCCKEINNL